MMTHMKERLAGKIGNANNNAFMLRKLFKMYDTAGSGFVSILLFCALQDTCVEPYACRHKHAANPMHASTHMFVAHWYSHIPFWSLLMNVVVSCCCLVYITNGG